MERKRGEPPPLLLPPPLPLLPPDLVEGRASLSPSRGYEKRSIGAGFDTSNTYSVDLYKLNFNLHISIHSI
uniref:Uncharacterized protein n=1 Tax=Oryza punctata TaxID=4537 RepID=A0A0E0ME44_ORYPU